MPGGIHNRVQRHDINLQATLSASSAMTENITPHHPITCAGELELDEHEFRCPHARVPADDERTTYCIQHSVALLMIEMAFSRFG